MDCQILTYHREREQHCSSMAELAAVRRRPEELADLHASCREQYDGGELDDRSAF